MREMAVLAGLLVIACSVAYTFEEPEPILNQIGWFFGCVSLAIIVAIITFVAVGVLL
jgi:hypothetical protein